MNARIISVLPFDGRTFPKNAPPQLKDDEPKKQSKISQMICQNEIHRKVKAVDDLLPKWVVLGIGQGKCICR